MNSVKTSGIVIKRSNLGEADRILTIFTERFGKIKAIAKGVRKTRSKLAGSLEPFMFLDLQLYEGKTFFGVTGAVIVDEYPDIHKDLKKTSQAYYLSELLDKFTEERQSQREIFNLYVQSLLSVEKNDSELLIEIFELKLVEHAGFKPQLFECVHCKEKLSPGGNFWDAVEGGVLCGVCQSKYKHGVAISDNAIKILRLIEKESGLEKKLILEHNLSSEVSKILSQYVKSVLEKEIKSERFMTEVSSEY